MCVCVSIYVFVCTPSIPFSVAVLLLLLHYTILICMALMVMPRHRSVLIVHIDSGRGKKGCKGCRVKDVKDVVYRMLRVSTPPMEGGRGGVMFGFEKFRCPLLPPPPPLTHTLLICRVWNSVGFPHENCGRFPPPSLPPPSVLLCQNPQPNAYTLAIRSKKPFIVLHTSLVDLMEPEVSGAFACCCCCCCTWPLFW